jgi:hypothetical protein
LSLAASKSSSQVSFPAASSSSFSVTSLSAPAEQQVFTTGMANLISAIRHTQDANYHKIMINIHLLVFALCWFGMVSLHRRLHRSSFIFFKG